MRETSRAHKNFIQDVKIMIKKKEDEAVKTQKKNWWDRAKEANESNVLVEDHQNLTLRPAYQLQL